jgi:hydrogenase maturation factor
VPRERYIDKKNAQAGDTVILTKTAGLEGTAVLAKEAREKLLQNGLSPGELDQANRFIDEISILKEAEIAAESGGVTAMHDVTEGGVATALRELAEASGRELTCEISSIPIHTLTKKICSAMDIDPLGLLGSGSLLICCRPESAGSILQNLNGAGVRAVAVGSLGKPGSCSLDLPEFPADEITKVLKE